MLGHTDWSLHRKGPVDQARHAEKIREAIRQNLPEIIAEESIITSDGNRTVKVPIRTLEEYRFRFDPLSGERVGQGDGDTQIGDVLGRLPGSGQGGGKGQPGDVPGVDYYEAEITVDELAELIFADLGLPDLKPKEAPQTPAEQVKFTDVRRQGAMNNLDKRRTILENIRRNARQGKPVFDRLNREDLRFKAWQQELRPSASAVVIAMRDASGSMGDFKKYITRSLFFWMVRFLRTRYEKVDIVFLAHSTEAREVTEEEFFTKGESGGTRCSSVYQAALDIIAQRYPPNEHNLYPFHFSDGDNLSSDNPKSVELVNKLLELCNLFGYGEIDSQGSGPSYYRTSTLHSLYGREIQHPRFVSTVIREKSEVYKALRAFFGPQMGEGGVA